MMAYFKEVGSKKLLKELNLNIIPRVKEQVVINNKSYYVTCVVLNTNNVTYTVWVRKFN